MDLFDEVLRDVQARLDGRGLSSGRVTPERVVAALDPTNRLQLWVTAPVDGDLVSVQIRSSRPVPRRLWPDVLRTVNDWNRRRRLTTAFLAVDDWELDTEGAVVVQAALPATRDVDSTMVAEFVDHVLADGMRFWVATI